MWVWLALSYAMVTSLHIIVIRRLSTAIGTLGYLFCNGALSTAALAGSLHAIEAPPSVGREFWIQSFLAAVIQLAGLALAVRSYQRGEISLVLPIAALTPAVVAVLGTVVLGERLNVLTQCGIALVLLGVYRLHAAPVPGGGWAAPVLLLASDPAVRTFAAAQAIWAFYPVAVKSSIQSLEPPSPAFAALTLGIIQLALVTPFAVVRLRRTLEDVKPLWPYLLCSAVMTSAGVLLELRAYALGPVGAVSALFKLSVLFGAFWAHLVLRESAVLDRLPAAVAMTTGAALIALA